jgi:hypothetical protein
MTKYKNNPSHKKHRYQYKSFFWSLNNKTTIESNSKLKNSYNTDIAVNENE